MHYHPLHTLLQRLLSCRQNDVAACEVLHVYTHSLVFDHSSLPGRIEQGTIQEGSLRCDVNVSVRPEGQEELGTRVEIKNMNSFSAMQQAIEYEVARQSSLMQEGKVADIVMETRLFDEATQVCSRPFLNSVHREPVLGVGALGAAGMAA